MARILLIVLVLLEKVCRGIVVVLCPSQSEARDKGQLGMTLTVITA